MKIILVLLGILVSFNCFGDVTYGRDFVDHEYLMVEENGKIEIYSYQPLYSEHNRS